MDYLFQEGSNDYTLVLLHGTGGDKQDLLPLAAQIDKDAAIISLEGDVEENGMKRFFKRKSPGVFDQEDLRKRTEALKDFLNDLAHKHNRKRSRFIAVGYSNGANIIASLLLRHACVFKAAFLHHPMLPFENVEAPKMKEMPIFIGAGKNDEICPPKSTLTLARLFKEKGANVDIYWHEQGHRITDKEIRRARIWHENTIKNS